MKRAIHWAMVREAVAFCLAMAALIVALHLCVGCGKPAEFPPYCYEAERFTAAILLCTEKSATRAESQECRRQLNASCGFVETVSKRAAP